LTLKISFWQPEKKVKGQTWLLNFLTWAEHCITLFSTKTF